MSAKCIAMWGQLLYPHLNAGAGVLEASRGSKIETQTCLCPSQTETGAFQERSEKQASSFGLYLRHRSPPYPIHKAPGNKRVKPVLRWLEGTKVFPGGGQKDSPIADARAGL